MQQNDTVSPPASPVPAGHPPGGRPANSEPAQRVRQLNTTRGDQGHVLQRGLYLLRGLAFPCGLTASHGEERNGDGQEDGLSAQGARCTAVPGDSGHVLGG